MTKVCIIGISGYGRIHYNLLTAAQAVGDVEIVGAAIINQDEEQERCAHLRSIGCRVFNDYMEMLDELSGQAELCCIPTGTPLHRTMTVAALEADMHVLVEKPAAGCFEDVRAMQAAAKKAGRIVAVGYQHMYTHVTMATKQAILDGRIGRVESITCLVMWPRDHDYYNRNSWAGALSVNGMTVNDSPYNNAVAHDLMMSLFLAGDEAGAAATPTSVEAQLYRANAIESADTAAIHVTTEEGVPIRFYATHACQESFGPEIHIRGSLGTIVKTHDDSILTTNDGKSCSLKPKDSGDMRAEMMSVVLDAVQGGSAFYCDLELASRQTMVVDSIHGNCEIVQVKGETVTSQNGKAKTFIPGIEADMRAAFDEECAGRDPGPLMSKMNKRAVVLGGFGHALCLFNEAQEFGLSLDLVGIAPAYTGEALDFFTGHPWFKEQNPPVFGNVAAALDGVEADLAIVSTRPDQICGAIRAALEAGLDVITEKPLALNHADLESLFERVKKTGRRVMPMFSIRVLPAFRMAREWVQTGKIGEPVLVNARKSYRWGTRPEWCGDRAIYGGTWPWVGIHAVDMTEFITGLSPVSVAAQQTFQTVPPRSSGSEIE